MIGISPEGGLPKAGAGVLWASAPVEGASTPAVIASVSATATRRKGWKRPTGPPRNTEQRSGRSLFQRGDRDLVATAAPARPGLLDRLGSTSHAWVAAASVALVVLMIVPVPPWVLDLLLSTNITLAIVILLVTLYTENALAFSVFPTLLLIVTLFRLSLNITGTRQILLHGYAGQVIEAFGNVVVGGNYAVGLVVFAILVVIQFVVITNGAGRVAEVAARFTLDAMPGKQLAVDADLNAGLITEAEARQRRKDIQRSADFY